MTALLPCPFCGYDMSADEDGAYQKAGFIGAQTPIWAVTCAGTDCNASVETISAERAIAAWNRREARAAVAELIEADKEYDAALTSWDAVRVTEAKQRRAAALARMGEGA